MGNSNQFRIKKRIVAQQLGCQRRRGEKQVSNAFNMRGFVTAYSTDFSFIPLIYISPFSPFHPTFFSSTPRIRRMIRTKRPPAADPAPRELWQKKNFKLFYVRSLFFPPRNVWQVWLPPAAFVNLRESWWENHQVRADEFLLFSKFLKSFSLIFCSSLSIGGAYLSCLLS